MLALQKRDACVEREQYKCFKSIQNKAASYHTMFLEPRLNKKMDSTVYCSSSKENRSALKLQGLISRPPPALAEYKSMNNPPFCLIVEDGSKWALCKTGPSFWLGWASLTSTACMCHNPLQLPPLAGDTTAGARAEPKSFRKFLWNCPRSPAEFAERCLWNSPQSLWSLAWTQSDKKIQNKFSLLTVASARISC